MNLSWSIVVIYVVLLVRISEGTSCMADVKGPHQNPTAVFIPNTDKIIIESQPAVFYCSYTCQDYNLGYIYWLYIDVLVNLTMPAEFIERNMEFLDRETEYEVKPYNFTVMSTQISLCNQTNNMTTYKIQILVSEQTPMLIPKCVLQYNGNLCSSLHTLFIIPSIESDSPISTTEEPPPPTTSTDFTDTIVTSQVPNQTSEPGPVAGMICIDKTSFGSGIGVLGILFTIETAVLVALLFIRVFYKCKPLKTQAVMSNDVMYMNGENNAESIGTTTKENKNKVTPVHAIPTKTLDIPNLVQDNDQ